MSKKITLVRDRKPDGTPIRPTLFRSTINKTLVLCPNHGHEGKGGTWIPICDEPIPKRRKIPGGVVSYCVSSDSDGEGTEDSTTRSTQTRFTMENRASGEEAAHPPSTQQQQNQESNLEFDRQVADLLEESNRLIEESEINLISFDSTTPTREVINLVESPAIQVIDLTDSPAPVDKHNEAFEQEKNIAKPDCPICFDELDKQDKSVTPCGHFFCTKCIKRTLDTAKLCPICKQKCTAKQLYPLYF